MTFIQDWHAALVDAAAVSGAHAALVLFKSYCAGALPGVPGMATGARLAMRVHAGRSVQEAAAREYLYRWNLAIKAFDQCEGNASSIFGTPHPIGM